MRADRQVGAETRTGAVPADETSNRCSSQIGGAKPSRSNWLPYGSQSISEEDICAVVEALRSDWLTQGPIISQFEREVSIKCGAKFAIAFSSGTSALHAAYFAAGIGAGHEIITTGMTFAATANAALYLGAVPKFADIDPSTGNINPSSVAGLITDKTQAVVGVDYGGHPCDIDELKTMAHSQGLTFIVDGAHSLGAFYKDSPVGCLADMTTLSFHPVKTITTGEGGMVLTDREDFAHKLKLFRQHGIEKDPECLSRVEGPWFHEMQVLGFNYRLTDFQAALGISQLKRLEHFIERRREIASHYREHLKHSKCFICLEEKPYVRSAYHLFPVLVNTDRLERKFAVEALHKENIGVQVHYIPTYRHPYYMQRFGDLWIEQCPVTENFYSRVFSFPLFPRMSDEDVDSVLNALDKVEKQFVSI